MEAIINKARDCANSDEMYSLLEQISHALSDAERRLFGAELSYDWNQIEAAVKSVATWKYLYKTVDSWAEQMLELEAEHG